MFKTAVRQWRRIWGYENSVRAPIRQTSLRSRLGIEMFEDRIVPTASGDFLLLQNDLQSFLNKANGALDSIVGASNATIPIINKSIGELTGLQGFVEELRVEVQKAIDEIGNLSNPANLELEAENLLNNYLGAGGLDILLSPANVILPTTADDNLLDIRLHLGRSAITSLEVGLGLASLPFHTEATFGFEVGFEIPELSFGLDKNAAFFVTADSVGLFARATLDNFTFDAEIGFLVVTAETNDVRSPNSAGTNPINALGVTLQVPVQNPLASNPSDIFGTPTLTGGASLDLHLTGGFAGAQYSAPQIEADFVLDWTFLNSQAGVSDSTFGSDLIVAFNNVKVSLGSYLTQMVGPTIEKVQQFVEPYKDFFQMLAEPIPIISDLAEVIGDTDGVSILDLAQIANSAGLIPPDYSAIVTVSSLVIQITNVINKIQTQKGNTLDSAFIELGNFDVVGNQTAGSNNGKDLREVAPASMGDVTQKDWSNLESIVQSIDYEVMKQKVAEAIGDNALSDALNGAIDALKNTMNGQGTPNSAGINLSFPITDKPLQAIAGMLIGRDTDLVSFEAWANLDGSTTIPVFTYAGFEIGLIGGITLEAYLKVGYDTYGLRQVVSKVFNNQVGSAEEVLTDLGNGFYVDPNTRLLIGGTIGIQGGVNWELAQAHVVGSLTAGISVTMPTTADLNNDGVIDDDEVVDADGDGKIRPMEFHPSLFVIAGQLSGSLSLQFKIGADPFSLSENIDIASGVIASFNTGGVNPFIPEGIQLAHFDPNEPGKLILNIGTYHGLLNSPQYAGVIHENVIISHSDTEAGETGAAVLVTMFGVTQRYVGVTSIYAEAGDGDDVITITKDVTVPVTIFGNEGNDTISVGGSTQAMVLGGAGNDKLTAGSGMAVFTGGAGNDILIAKTGNVIFYGGDFDPNSDPNGDDLLIGGSGTNAMHGGNGNDTLVGGSGPNILYGGDGDDKLYGGSTDGDVLYGGNGNDRFILGTGSSTVYGEGGNDEFVWSYVDPDNGILAASGSAMILGGGGRDLVVFNGGPNADTFTVSRQLPTRLLSGYDVLVTAPGEGGLFSLTNIWLGEVEDIAIEAGEGADHVTVNDLTNTRVFSVGINLRDLVKSHYGIGDNAVDTIVVNATPNNDNVSISAEPVMIQLPINHGDAPLMGGITTIAGLPNYVVKIANVNDDVTFNARGGNDTVNVFGITGPTVIRGNGGAAVDNDNDTFIITATAADKFVSEVVIDADGGTNAIQVIQPTAAGDTFVVSQEQIESGLVAVNFTATGGTFQGGVSLTTGGGDDFVHVKYTLPNVHTIVNTAGGNDTVVLSSKIDGGTTTAILGTVTVNLGSGSSNLLRVSNAGAMGGNPNAYVGQNQLVGFAGPGGSTSIQFGATGGDMTLHLQGNSGAQPQKYVIEKPAAKLIVESSSGNDTFDVVALDHAALLTTGAGNDLVRIGYGNNTLAGIKDIVMVNAGAGSDIVAVYDTAAASAGAYTLGTSAFTRAGGGVWFDGALENLYVYATAGDDTVSVTGTPLAGNVTLAGNNGNDTLVGPNLNSTWQLTGTNTGLLGSNIAFNGFENLTGGSGNDLFRVTNTKGVTGKIVGGAGTDTLDYSAATAGVVINLATKTATGLGGFDGIESFGGGAGSDELVGPNLPNLWQITGANSGQVATMAMGTLAFSGIEMLRGGSSTDAFGFGPNGAVRVIRGEGGTDTLDYSAIQTSGLGVVVNLTLGTASKVSDGVFGIENVTGSPGDDLIVGDANANVLKGGGGRDILIGGLGADGLDGGLGDDLLIGGPTVYDSDPASLSKVQAEWRSNASYDVRRMRLLGQLVGGANGNVTLSDAKVPNDGAQDNLIGGDGQDWFWGWGVDLMDLVPAQGEKNRAL